MEQEEEILHFCSAINQKNRDIIEYLHLTLNLIKSSSRNNKNTKLMVYNCLPNVSVYINLL